MQTLLLLLALLVPGSVLAEGVLTPAANPPDAVLYDYRNTVKLQEDFMTGNNTSGQIGRLGWSFTNGTAAIQASVANRPGIMRRATSAVSGTLASFYQYSGITAQWAASTDFDMVWIIRLNQVDANTSARWGAFFSYLVNPPSDGAYFERLDGEANYYCVSRASSTQTRTDSGIAADTNFHRFEMKWRTTGITWAIDGVQVCGTITTNLSSNVMHGASQIINSAAADKTIDHDYYEVTLYGLTR